MAIRKATFYVRDLTSIYQGNLHISDDPMFDICRRDAWKRIRDWYKVVNIYCGSEELKMGEKY